MMSQENTTSSNVGLAISQALILTGMVQYGIRQMMESFQLFTNTERVLQYTKMEQEPLILRKPTRDWPFKGIHTFSITISQINSIYVLVLSNHCNYNSFRLPFLTFFFFFSFYHLSLSLSRSVCIKV